jgi:AraC-like DNA-binding protein
MLYIEPRLFEQLTGAGAYFPSAMAHDPALTARFRQVFRAMWQASDDIAFLSAFTTLVDDVVARHGRHAAPVETAAPHALGRAIERIEDGLGGALTVAMLADAAGLSLFHFIRAFSARYHVPPHQYLQARRTARAKLLLAQRMPPAQAADAVGLTDQSHLNRWFKRAYGVTPAQYQQQIGTRPASGARA